MIHPYHVDSTLQLAQVCIQTGTQHEIREMYDTDSPQAIMQWLEILLNGVYIPLSHRGITASLLMVLPTVIWSLVCLKTGNARRKHSVQIYLLGGL